MSQKMYIDGHNEKMLEDVCGHPINFIADSSASYSGDDDGNNDIGDNIDYDMIRMVGHRNVECGYTISFNVDVSNLLLIYIGVGNFLSPDVLLSNVCFYFFGGGSSLSQQVFVIFLIEQSLPSSNLVERTFKLSMVDQGC